MQIAWGAPDRAGQDALPVHVHTTKIELTSLFIVDARMILVA